MACSSVINAPPITARYLSGPGGQAAFDQQ